VRGVDDAYYASKCSLGCLQIQRSMSGAPLKVSAVVCAGMLESLYLRSVMWWSSLTPTVQFASQKVSSCLLDRNFHCFVTWLVPCTHYWYPGQRMATLPRMRYSTRCRMHFRALVSLVQYLGYFQWFASTLAVSHFRAVNSICANVRQARRKRRRIGLGVKRNSVSSSCIQATQFFSHGDFRVIIFSMT